MEEKLITIPEAKVLGLKEGESFKQWCEKNGLKPHPLSLIAEDIIEQTMKKIKE